jgi:hypothetical protein
MDPQDSMDVIETQGLIAGLVLIGLFLLSAAIIAAIVL